MKVAALLDASVLYPSTVRSVLMYLAVADIYKPLWSDCIQDEWTSALLRDRPDLSPMSVARTRLRMEANATGASIAGFEAIIPGLVLPDPDDRHVLAAAIHGRASLIVTSNIRHFPRRALKPHGIAAIRPDDFILTLLDAARASVVEALAADRVRQQRPPVDAPAYLLQLARSGLRRTAAALEADLGAL